MGLWNAIVLCYFATHIPATLIIDAQAALPSLGIAHPAWARALLDWYCQQYADPCMCTRPPWFTAIVWVEVLIQLPFFFAVLWAWRAFEYIRVEFDQVDQVIRRVRRALTNFNVAFQFSVCW
jgi:hypothetical protein